MANTRGEQLAEVIRRKVANLKQACEGVDEATASRVPPGGWSPKMILSHLCGPEGMGHLPLFKAFVDRDTPKVALDAGNPFFTDTRAGMRFGELVAECEANYRRVAEFAAGLTDEQLARKAHIPALKESPLGEYPTLDGMIFGLTEFHIQDHTDHLRKTLEAPPAQG
jgi:hypothetical protein